MGDHKFLRDELIEDREVATSDEDRLGHEQIAQQLFELARLAKTPTNIALYGPWGSGKSGISNLLRVKVREIKGAKFVRFDAFKYAENPLRRNFISVAATELGINDREFHDDLYTGRVSADFHVPIVKGARVLISFAILVFGCSIAIAAFGSILGFLSGSPDSLGFVEKIRGTLGDAIIPAALLTTILSVFGKTFVVQKKIEKADSDEQFEALLDKLVAKAGVERLIIFVDELDRCSPTNVVATLDAIRTFLGAKKCVFVVASDQQVLEKALTDSLQQATPLDRINPYYSAGSAYLDKVFQYQVSVPPLLPQSITRFAADIVKEKPGVWGKIDRDFIVSLLIPSHVRSPRRVKNLLNSFVLTYRLAKALNKNGQLEADVDARADELAKLVCFRAEFPLFARDLVSDPRLPEYILALTESPDSEVEVWKKYPNVAEETKQVAKSYAQKTAPVDVLLAERDEARQGVGDQIKSEVAQRQGEQLLDYLARTKTVNGPKRDLIHLQTTGNLFGLEVSIAEGIERASQNASLGQLRQICGDLDKVGHVSAFSFLLQQLRVAVGIERANVMAGILTIAQDEELDLDSMADTAIKEACTLIPSSPSILNVETLAGAWRLALHGRRDDRNRLAAFVLQEDLTFDDPDIAREVIRSAQYAFSINRDRVKEKITKCILEAPEDYLVLLEKAGSDSSLHVLSECGSSIGDGLKALVGQADNDEKKSAAQSTLAEFSAVIESLLSIDRAIGEALLKVILSVDNALCRDAVQEILQKYAPIKDEALVELVLKNTQPRVVALWPKWISCVDPKVVRMSVHGGRLRSLISGLISSSMKQGEGELSIDVIRNAAAALASLTDNFSGAEQGQLSEHAVQLGSFAKDEDTTRVRKRSLEVANVLIDVGLTTNSEVAHKEAEGLIASLSEELSPQSADSAISLYVVESVLKVMHGWRLDGAVTFVLRDDVQADLLEAVEKCGWLPEPERAILGLKIRGALAANEVAISAAPPANEAIMALVAGHEGRVQEIAAAWLGGCRPTAIEALPLVEPIVVGSPNRDFLVAFQEWRTGLNKVEHVELLKHFLLDFERPLLDAAVLAALGLQDAPEADLTSILIQRFEACMNNGQRRAVLEVWRMSSVKDNRHRRILIEKILIQLLKLNSTAAEMALNYFNQLALPIPASIRSMLGKAALDAADLRPDLRDKVHSVLKRAGYKSSKKGFIFKRETFDVND